MINVISDMEIITPPPFFARASTKFYSKIMPILFLNILFNFIIINIVHNLYVKKKKKYKTNWMLN